jgi:hypothetical protein
VNTQTRSITVVAAIVVAAGVSWIGLKQHQRRQAHIACIERDEAFTQRVESIKRDAREQLKIGTKKEEISRFFTEHGIQLSIDNSEAIGTLYTSGCSPLGCGTDSALIGVRVNVDRTGTVTGEPTVVGMYTDCV